MAKVGVIGWGFVGQATGKGFETSKENQVVWYDKYKESGHKLEEVVEDSEFIFVCVPTPMFKDYSGIDESIVKEVVHEVAPMVSGTDKVVLLKSTMLPGMTEAFIKKYPGVNFVANPEFLTQENANRDFLNPSRTIIGVKDKSLGERVKKLYRTILPKDQKYFITGPTEAEVAKYMSNLMLASKVLLANEFLAISREVGADYEDVRLMVEADPRIGTHLRAPGSDGELGFGGACFPKDMVGLLSFAKEKGVDVAALEAIWEKNLKIRKNRDWEKMDNAFGKDASKIDS